MFLNNPRVRRAKPGGQAQIKSLRPTGNGAVDTFVPEEKARLLTDFYTSLFEATERHRAMPGWVDLNKHYHKQVLTGLPRIDGALMI